MVALTTGVSNSPLLFFIFLSSDMLRPPAKYLGMAAEWRSGGLLVYGSDSIPDLCARRCASAGGKLVHHLSDLTDKLEQVGIGQKRKLTVNRNGQNASKPMSSISAVLPPSGQFLPLRI
jgi:hypothetical protein